VDLDGNGTLDFSEFLCLLYLWVDKGAQILKVLRIVALHSKYARALTFGFFFS
jgi:hypothetical protein